MREPQLLDPSSIIDFQTCPRKFFYRYLLGWRPDIPNNHLIFGQALHTGLERLFNSQFSEVEEAVTDATAVWREHFPPEQDENYFPKTPHNLALALHLYAMTYGEQVNRDYEVMGVEVVGFVPVSFDYDIVFRLDTVLKDKSTGKYSIWEHKSASGVSSLFDNQWILSTQVCSYYLALTLTYGSEFVDQVVIDQVVFYKRKGIRTDKPPVELRQLPIRMSEKQLAIVTTQTNVAIGDIFYEYESLEDQKKNQIMSSFPMRPPACTEYMQLCPYHDFCIAWPNPLHKMDLGPPPGFRVEFWDPTQGKLSTKEPQDE